ncbi:MAG: hypothetical protein LUG66_02535 [Clostridiales bacterium]|nr:hypothetical protein [Clostridiales bacterium]
MNKVDEILESEAFKGLGEERLKALRNFLAVKNPSVQEIFAFMTEVNKGGSLTPPQQRELFSAFSERLSEREKRQIDNILEVMKAFS